MKILQEETKFSPVAIILETREDVGTFWDLIACARCDEGSDADALLIKISDWLSNEANL